MKRIILFVFHRNFIVCKNHLDLLKKFNPEIKIYGLFGGSKKDLGKVRKIFDRKYLEKIYLIPNQDAKWKWQNGDLALIDWFKEVGNSIDFEMLHLVQWDLLMFDSIDKIYSKIPKNGIGLTGLVPLKKVEQKWDWTSEEPDKSEWNDLLNYAKKNFDYKKEPFASLGPGTCLPKKFLSEYSKIHVPELVHDELRIPLFGQIFGFKLYDTGFYRSWFNSQEEKIFNCIPKDIKLGKIKEELAKKYGRKVFHPYRKIINLNLMNLNS